eukprot:TRINITY_DN2141_c0_g2_i5.p1 TRINITY_DN2141_c0_g2~~TRINITY_DN2141_c0_g2_i5.p1  ORF type:complete len:152 (-),score=23.54 TRINITY_DN2141_c0_g2_i5:82-537(-)
MKEKKKYTRVRCVRTEPNSNKRIALKFMKIFDRFFQIFRVCFCPSRGKTQNSHSNIRSHSNRNSLTCSLFRKIIHVGEARGTTQQHFSYCQLASISSRKQKKKEFFFVVRIIMESSQSREKKKKKGKNFRIKKPEEKIVGIIRKQNYHILL